MMKKRKVIKKLVLQHQPPRLQDKKLSLNPISIVRWAAKISLTIHALGQSYHLCAYFQKL
jgi:hypothetical protein